MRRRSGRDLATIAASALVLYAPVAAYDFVYDDHWTIADNLGLAAPLRRVLHALLFGTAGRLGLADATRPTMVVSTWVDRHLFGLSPIGFHLHSLALFVGVAVAAWMLLRELLGRPRAALFGALFFVAAPLHAEAVACVNYREDLLVALGTIAVLVLFFAPRRLRSPRPTGVEVAGVVVAMIVALGAKESGFAIPLLVAAVAWAKRVDLSFIRRRDAFVLAMLLTMVVFLNWRFTVPDDVPRGRDLSWFLRVTSTARYEVRAALGAFVPFFWSPERASREAASVAWLAPFAALVALCVWLRRSARLRPFALALAFALVAPVVSSPLSLPNNEFADRYLFLAVFGGAIAFGTVVDRLLRATSGRAKRAGAILAAAVLGAEAIVAVQAHLAFRNDAAVWHVAVERAPDSPRAWTGLSHVLRVERRLSDADRAAARALALDPSYAPARLSHAYNLIALGDVLEARAELSALGEDDHLTGLRRARECAALDADKARECISR